LASATGLSFSTGTGSADVSMSFTGTLADINAALDGLSYSPATNFSGSDALSIVTDDQGNTGSGGALSDSDVIGITVTAVNSAPTLISNTGLTLDEGGGAAITSSMLAVSDLDNTPAELTYTLTGIPANGTLNLNGIALIVGSTFTQADIAANLLSYVHDGSETTADGFQFTVSDGAGGNIGSTTFSITVDPVNSHAPVITSNGGGSSASVNIAENTTAVTTVTATDADLPAQTLSYAIAGGADAAKFVIDSSTGTLSFISAPDFENPADADTNNIYDVIVEASDGALTDTQTLSVTITPANDNAPVITSNGGSGVASLNVAENTTAVTTVTAADADLPAQTLIYSITGGADAAAFAIDGATGALSFITAPDFENPADAGADNIYNVIVQASDGTLTGTQAIAVAVTPANDNAPVITSNGGGASAALSIAENSTAITTVTATDADLPAQTLNYAIVGGADAGHFAIDAVSGAMSFVSAPDYEVPTDANADNIYDVVVQVNDGAGGSQQQILSVTVTDANDAPNAAMPGTQSANPAISLPIVGISVQDQDNNINTVSLSVAHGTLTVSLASGASISGGSNGSSALTLSGTQAQINTALSTITYDSASTFLGQDALSLTVADSAGATHSAAMAINVSMLRRIVDDGGTMPTSLPPNVGDGVGNGSNSGNGDTAGQIPLGHDTGPAESEDRLDDEFITSSGNVLRTNADAWKSVDENATHSSRQHVSVGADLESVLLSQLARLPDVPGMTVARPGDVDLLGSSSASRINIGNSLTVDLGSLHAPDISDDGPFGISPAQAGKAVTAVVAAGVVWWAGRSVGLLTALMASVPAWRTVDPLPILARSRKRQEQSELEQALDPDTSTYPTETARSGAEPQPRRALLTDIEY
ncbi:MAG TPA: cadherin-like domain-containing protein, partial [Rhodocyclaceae bacterium]|nr:cadherin-like domain-containing protein [Rhodocyclaceae bacterium]